MHGRTRLTFWQQHAWAGLIAIPLVAVARMIGQIANVGDAPDVILHTAIIILIAHPLFTATAYACMRYLPKQVPLRLKAIAGCVLISPVIAFLAPIVSWFVGVGPDIIITATTRAELASAISGRYPFILLGFSFLGTLVWMVLNFSWWRVHFGDGPSEEPASSDHSAEASEPVNRASADGPKFLSKIPFAKRGELWALSSELHYVRVYTSRGDDLVLMRLSDAVEQTDGVEGLQIHRSHWIATEGVAQIENSGGKMQVILKNEIALPVSRSHQGAVRNALGHLLT